MVMGAMSQEKRIDLLQKLCKEYTKAQDVKGVLRCKALLAWYKGIEWRTIQSCLGMGRKALKRWRQRFEAEGSVSDRERSGRPPKLPVEYAEQMKALIMEQKQRVWTARHVFVVLQTVFGVVYSVKYLPQWLGKLGLSFHKAIHFLIRRDNEKRRDWIQTTLPALYAQALQEGWRIFFQDEVGFQTEGTVTYTWARKGEKIEIPNYGRHGRVNLIGAFELGTAAFYGVLTSRQVNAMRFRRFLCHLKHEMRSDKILLITDNARFHKAAWLKEWVASQAAWLRLEFLPAYSPDFNPIEQLWRWFKREFIHNVCWDSKSALFAHLTRSLAQLPAHASQLLGLMRRELLRYKTAFDFYQTPFPEAWLPFLPDDLTPDGQNFSG
jgi:putative transposase